MNILNLKKINKELIDSVENSYSIKKELIRKDQTVFKIINLIYSSISSKKKVFICGNGGSAADSEHISAEFLVRLNPKINRKPFPIISLTQGVSTITACSNDYDYSEIFSRNYQALYSKGDLLICLSTSGNSKNVVKVTKFALSKKNKVICFLGKNGGSVGKIKNSLITKININSNNVARIQETYMFLLHFILGKVEEKLIKIK